MPSERCASRVIRVVRAILCPRVRAHVSCAPQNSAHSALTDCPPRAQAYDVSLAACPNGASGVIVTFADTTSRRRLTSDNTLHADDVMGYHFHSRPSVAASVSEASLTAYLNDPSVVLVEADCIVNLDDGFLSRYFDTGDTTSEADPIHPTAVSHRRRAGATE